MANRSGLWSNGTETDWDVYISLSEGINGCAICLTFWIIVNMIVHGIKTGKLKNAKGGKLYVTCFVAIVVAFVKIIVCLTLFEVSKSNSNPNICKALNTCTAVLGPVTLYLVYFCLWLRQRSLFDSPVLRKRLGLPLQVFSWFILILMTAHQLFSAISVSILFIDSLQPTPKGCFFQAGSVQASVMTSLVILQVISQVGLLFLFIYPLLNKRCSLHTDRPQKKSHDKMFSAARRAVIWTFLAILSDNLVLTMTQNLLPPSHPSIIGVAQISLDNFLNNICVLALFKERRKILLAVHYCSKSDDKSTSTAQTGSSELQQKSRTTQLEL